MTKEQLKAMGLTDEQVESVWKGLEGSYVTKARFNEVNTALNTAQTTLQERDTQLETLTKSTGDVEALKAQITELQAANKTRDDEHQAALAALQFDTALTNALTTARARNPKAVRALLDADALKLADGNIVGLREQLETIKKDNDYLFEPESAGGAGFGGKAPTEKPANANEAMNAILRGALKGD